MSVQFDGKVVAVGYNGTDPILMRAYGYEYIPQFAQAPDQVAAGILDATLWPNSGALELDNYSPISTTITTLGGSQVARIYEYPAGGANNGKALLLFSGTRGGLDTVLARVNKDLTLDASFALGAGFITIADLYNASALFVDSSSNIYVAGTTSDQSWIRAYNNSGIALTGWSAPESYLTAAYQVGLQSIQRTILAGINGDGTLVGYNSSGILDNTFGLFGTPGLVDMGSTDPITDFTIDTVDTIITVKISDGSTVLQRVSSSGLVVTLLSDANAAPITNAIGNAKVILDEAGNIVVASATLSGGVTGFALARYNNDATGTVNGSQVTISVNSAVT